MVRAHSTSALDNNLMQQCLHDVTDKLGMFFICKITCTICIYEYFSWHRCSLMSLLQKIEIIQLMEEVRIEWKAKQVETYFVVVLHDCPFKFGCIHPGYKVFHVSVPVLVRNQTTWQKEENTLLPRRQSL